MCADEWPVLRRRKMASSASPWMQIPVEINKGWIVGSTPYSQNRAALFVLELAFQRAPRLSDFPMMIDGSGIAIWIGTRCYHDDVIVHGMLAA